VLYIKPLERNTPVDIKRRSTSFDEPPKAWDFEYAVPENFIGIRSIGQLLNDEKFDTSGYDFIVVELPALLVQDYPATLTQSGQLSILVGRATRSWNKADEEVILLYRSSIDHPVLALLNACQVDQLESIIGEIPKKRNPIRRLVKKIINMNFKTAFL
jgi:hypothetical protein